MKLLFLCDKKYWNHKMSRARFHSIDAVGRHPDVELVKDGPGWDIFDNVGNSIRRHEPDAVMWYKPLDMLGYEKAKTFGIPVVIRYNEMWWIEHTENEIVESGSDVVICHHENDMPQYKHLPSHVKLFHCPHCAENSVFHPMNVDKKYDVVLLGNNAKTIYPLRYRLTKIIRNQLIPRGYECRVFNHPGYEIKTVEDQVYLYAERICQARIAVACSSIYKYALAKYVETGMCGTAIVADIPGERQDWFRSWVLEISADESDKRIAGKIRHWLASDEWKAAGDRGRHACLKFATQEHYAQKFVDILKGVLNEKARN